MVNIGLVPCAELIKTTGTTLELSLGLSPIEISIRKCLMEISAGPYKISFRNFTGLSCRNLRLEYFCKFLQGPTKSQSDFMGLVL